MEGTAGRVVGLPLAFAAAKPELTDALADKVALEQSL